MVPAASQGSCLNLHIEKKMAQLPLSIAPGIVASNMDV